MQLTLTADWTNPTSTASRIAIAGYTAVVDVAAGVNLLGEDVPLYEFTVLRDHFEIVEVGQRGSRVAAQEAVERIIAEHAATLSVSA